MTIKAFCHQMSRRLVNSREFSTQLGTSIFRVVKEESETCVLLVLYLQNLVGYCKGEICRDFTGK
jgi:hypothetical protein